MNTLKFYTTLGCHLCEEAEHFLNHLVSVKPVEFDAIDISSSAELVELYGLRIPVVKNVETEVELGWPFDYQQLMELAQVAE